MLGGNRALVIAIALGSLTSFLVWRYVSDVGQTGRKSETVAVVVAKASIPARTMITAEMVRMHQVPAEALHPNAQRDLQEVVGKIARNAISPDEQVLSTRLYLQREESGLAFMIPEGMRAVSVGFTEVIGSGGMIVPGDHVDVMSVFEVKLPSSTPVPGPILRDSGSGDKGHVTVMVLQNVEVLAVAQQLQGQDTRDTMARLAQDSGSNGSGTNPSQQIRSQPPVQPQAKTATLAVSPEDALRLVLAEEKGKIRLALRRAKDQSVMSTDHGPFDIIHDPIRPLAKQ